MFALLILHVWVSMQVSHTSSKLGAQPQLELKVTHCQCVQRAYNTLFSLEYIVGLHLFDCQCRLCRVVHGCNAMPTILCLMSPSLLLRIRAH